MVYSKETEAQEVPKLECKRSWTRAPILQAPGTDTASEENRHWSQQSYFRYVSSGKGNKCKNKQIGPHQTEKFLHSQGSCQKNIYDKMICLIYYS